jgi:hypothetical protein
MPRTPRQVECRGDTHRRPDDESVMLHHGIVGLSAQVVPTLYTVQGR